MSFTPSQGPDRGIGDSLRLMLISDQRVFYFGLLGTPGLRNFGCATLYVAQRGPLEVDQGGGWQQGYLAWVPPYTPHRIRARDRQLAVIMVEPEFANTDVLAEIVGRGSGDATDPLRGRVLSAVGRIRQGSLGTRFADDAFDRLVFGRELPPRILDDRVTRAVNHLSQLGAEVRSAASLAAGEGLSQSRFLHLFKEQAGVCLRKFRAWRRARGLLYHVHSAATLTDIALEVGYPDSTHFSHSIRKVYGLPPRAIVSGSRRLKVRVQTSAVPVSSRKCPLPAAGMVGHPKRDRATVDQR